MSYLLDTNVLSELRKGKRCDSNVARWFAQLNEGEILVSVLTIGEIRMGIERIRRRDVKGAAALERWLKALLDHFRDRILPIDCDIAEEWGRMNVPNPLPVIDSLLAATAKKHSLCIATRNTKDIARTGVDCMNPFGLTRREI